MKLYNLYKEVILEAEEQDVNATNVPCFGSTDGKTTEEIIDALIEGCEDANGNKFWYPANIWYDGEGQPRYVFIHALGNFKGGIGIRAWQTAGPSKSGEQAPPEKINAKVGWRIFFIKDIKSVRPANFKIYNPFDGYAGPDTDQKMINGRTIKGIKK